MRSGSHLSPDVAVDQLTLAKNSPKTKGFFKLKRENRENHRPSEFALRLVIVIRKAFGKLTDLYRCVAGILPRVQKRERP